jgi:hypothetical protein
MGIVYSCKPKLKLALVVWDGLVTWDEWRQHLQRMLVDPDYAPMQSQITDLRHSTISPGISNKEIQAMIDMVADQRENISLTRVAIVAGDEWSKPKLAEVGLRSLSISPIVFNHLSLACQWLGLQEVEISMDLQQIHNKHL